ncbi:hypothetical protein BB561_005460 [Smittium simulii]|uniref:Endonuclease/exonuclease/phosphatase domain-containing protein n=1 Tax=Smittium simulii TaxID=133385 RepID=A0A2T9YAA2_9FUNG|nr:hypothetical protein BB561_005460 [Smittium simulii]
MLNVPGVIPSATADVSLTPAKRTRLEYSTVAKTGLIDPATKNDYNFNFPAKNNQNNQNNQKNTKNQKKNEKFKKFQQNNKNNVKKIINPAFNSQEFTEVSSMHLLDNSISKALKKACYGGSNTKIGCSWTQFSGNINAAIDYVALKIDDKYVSYQHDSKATYFMFYNEKPVELYQTVSLEEGTQIITIPNTNSVNIIKLVEAVNNTFTKNGIIYDFSAYKNKSSGKFHTFGVKFLFKKTIYSFEIPTFLEIDKFVLALTYRGSSGKENEIIVINIHTPHLATEKKIMKKQIELYLRNIISKNENKKIILAGDFNMDTKSTINWVNKIGVRLTRMPVFNSRGSRLNGIKIGRMIDHICSVNLDFQFIGASTLDAEKTKKIDRELITLKSDKIISHNYYAVLSEHIESTSDTNIIVSDTILKSNDILNELKINKPIKNTKRQIQAIECALNHKNRSTWQYIKSNLKFKKSSTTTTAIINEDFELIGGNKESLAVWANHFAQLAQTTSNGNNNFELFPLNKIDVFSECNN